MAGLSPDRAGPGVNACDVRQRAGDGAIGPAEYWLLNAVVEAEYALHWLVAENLEEMFNAPGHGLRRAELIAVLTRLFQAGDLFAVERERLVPVRTLVPTPQELEAALCGQLDLTYGLTAHGGARWEAVSQPDWTHFVSVSYGSDDAELIGLDRQIVERYLAWQHYHWPEMVVSAATIVWDVLTPWAATYWKQLPGGHRVRYKLRHQPRVWVETPPQISAWFQGLAHWYTHPFPKDRQG